MGSRAGAISTAGSDMDPLPCVWGLSPDRYSGMFLLTSHTVGQQMRWGSAHSRYSGNVSSPSPHGKAGCMKMLSFLLFSTQRGLAICPRRSPVVGPGSCVLQTGRASLGTGTVSGLGLPPGALCPWKEVLTCQVDAEQEIEGRTFPTLLPHSPDLLLLKHTSPLATACSRAFSGSPGPTIFF